MAKKFTASFILVGICIFLLKSAVDVCLPFRESALFPQFLSYEHPMCRVFFNWDASARSARMKVAEGFITLNTKIEKDSLDPAHFTPWDFALVWRTPQILPLILEAAPMNPQSTLKLLAFWTGFSILMTGIWHYLSVFLQTLKITQKHLNQRLENEHRPFEKLLGRDR